MLCSEVFHDPTPCTNSQVKCITCKSLHTNNSKECSMFKREYAIQKIKVTERLSYIESKRKYNAMFPASFASSRSSYSKPMNTHTENIEQMYTHPTTLILHSASSVYAFPPKPTESTSLKFWFQTQLQIRYNKEAVLLSLKLNKTHTNIQA